MTSDGGTNVPDSTTNNYDGLVSGATWSTNGGGSYTFDGLNDDISATAAAVSPLTSSQSVSLWIRSNGTLTAQKANAGIWIQLTSAAPNAGRPLFIYKPAGEKLGIGYTESDGDSFLTFTPVLSNYSSRWHHVVGVYDDTANTIKVYSDAVLLTNYTGATGVAAPNSLNRVYLGDQHAGGDHWFKGMLDDLRHYGKALSALEVTNLYNGGSAAHPNP